MAAGTMVRRVLLQIGADDAQAVEKIDAIKIKAEELRTLHPELTPRINTAEAAAKMRVLRDELKAVTVEADAEPPIEVKVSSAAAQAKLDLIKKNAEELRLLNPTLVPKIDISEAEAKLSVLRGELTATKTESAGLGKAWDVTKYALLGVGAGLAYGTVKAAGFEQAMLRVHTQAGVATSQLGSLGSQVLQLAGQVGQNPDSLAESLYHVASNMASMGATGPQMMNAVKIAAEGASLGGADLVDVTNALGAAIASGIPGVQNYQSAMGALNATVGAGDMKMQDLAEAMGTGFLSNVKIYGSTLNDVGAILATFGDNNIRGAHAGTQLRMSVQSIAVQAASAKPYLAQLGLQIGELGKYQSLHGTVATINLLVQRLHASGIAQNEWGNIITQLFGKKAGAGIAVLIDQYERLDSKSKVLADGAKGFAKAWEEQSKSPQQQLKDLEAGSQALAISLGIKLLPVATKVMSWLNSFIQGLQHGSGVAQGIAGVIGGTLGLIALGKLSSGLEGGIKAIEGMWKSGGKLVTWAEKMAGNLGLLKTAQEGATVATDGEAVAQKGLNLAFLTSPIGLIVIGIAGLVIAFVELWRHCAGFRDFWKAAWRDIKIAFDETWGFIKSHWELILSIITGPVGAAAIFVITHWHQITAGAAAMFHDVVSFFTSLPHRILSALGDMGHLLWNAGVSVVQGLINGVTSMFGSLGSVASSIGSSLLGGVKSMLGIGSPSKEFYKLGAWITLGLGGGIRDTAHQAISESRRLGAMVMQAANDGLITGTQATQLEARIAAALRTQLNRAATAAARDRKIMENLGLILHQGLMQGLTGTSGQVSSAVSKLLAMIKTEMNAGFISYGRATSITDWLEGDSRRLQSLATKRASILATIKAAETYAANVTSSTEQAFGLISAAGSVTPALGVGGIVGQLLGDVAQIKVFKQNIAKLRRMGLNKAYIDQLIQAGPVQGGQIAAELAAGNEGDIRAINSAESQIASASVSLGQTAANAMYDSGKNAGKGFLSGLQGQLAALNALMRQLARSMVAELRKELGIRSPSEVMRQHGRMIGEGLKLGIEDSMPMIAAAAQRMGHTVQTGTTGAHAAAAGAAAAVVQIQIVGGDKEFRTWLKKQIRITGGNAAVIGA